VLNYDIIRLGRKARRAVAQRVKIFEDEDDDEGRERALSAHKHRVIASSNGLIVSGVSSPILETRKLFPFIFP